MSVVDTALLPPRLLSIEKAAALLGIHPRTVYRMLSDGELPYVKLGRRTLLSVASLDSWITAHEVPAASPQEEHVA